MDAAISPASVEEPNTTLCKLTSTSTLSPVASNLILPVLISESKEHTCAELLLKTIFCYKSICSISSY